MNDDPLTADELRDWLSSADKLAVGVRIVSRGTVSVNPRWLAAQHRRRLVRRIVSGLSAGFGLVALVAIVRYLSEPSRLHETTVTVGTRTGGLVFYGLGALYLAAVGYACSDPRVPLLADPSPLRPEPEAAA